MFTYRKLKPNVADDIWSWCLKNQIKYNIWNPYNVTSFVEFGLEKNDWDKWYEFIKQKLVQCR